MRTKAINPDIQRLMQIKFQYRIKNLMYVLVRLSFTSIYEKNLPIRNSSIMNKLNQLRNVLYGRSFSLCALYLSWINSYQTLVISNTISMIMKTCPARMKAKKPVNIKTRP